MDDRTQFSCRYRMYGFLHTHAPAENVLYHLGRRGLEGSDYNNRHLSPEALQTWKSLTSRRVREVLKEVPILKIIIPARTT